MEARQLAPGLWRWTALHPDWTEADAEDGHGWEQEVASGYLETAGHVLLFDPLVPEEPKARATFLDHLDADVRRNGKTVAILLTVHWHERSAAELAERYDAEAWVRAPDVERVQAPAHGFAPGDVLPGGVVGIEVPGLSETLYWLPEEHALVTGDAILGGDGGGVRVCPDRWLPDGVEPDALRLSLRGLLELPVELVLPAHGEPVLAEGRAALERALAPRAPV